MAVSWLLELETGLVVVPVPVATCNNARLAFPGYVEKDKEKKKTVGILYQWLLGKPGSNIDTNIPPNIRGVRGQDFPLRWHSSEGEHPL